ncbi:hypothetical protein KCU67_g6749, partial [Aureobasidium melanogenum]
MNPPTSFSSFPPELVTKICRDSTLEKEDLIALRLTSKSQGIHLSASKELAKRYFENIKLLYTRYSLEAFMEICKHPVFGLAVRKVQLSYARFVPDCFEEESKAQFDNVTLDGRSSQGRHVYLDNIQRLVNRCDEEENLKESNNAEDLLVAAFTALAQRHHPLELAVSWYESCALGKGRIHSPGNLGENSRWECDVLGVVNLLHHAATRGACVVQTLQVQGAVWDNLIDSSSDSLSSLAHLSELGLDIWPTGDMSSFQVAGLDAMVTKLLENAVHLRTLRLLESSYFDDGPQYLRSVFTTMSRMKLEKITLTYVDLDQFKPFENRIESLRHLEVIECETRRSLKNVLLSIQNNLPQLEYLHLSEYRGRQVIEFQGVQGISDGIDKLMQSRLNHHNNPGWDALYD